VVCARVVRVQVCTKKDKKSDDTPPVNTHTHTHTYIFSLSLSLSLSHTHILSLCLHLRRHSTSQQTHIHRHILSLSHSFSHSLPMAPAFLLIFLRQFLEILLLQYFALPQEQEKSLYIGKMETRVCMRELPVCVCLLSAWNCCLETYSLAFCCF
jgi:hypothetical protein